jgi:hypothetical protein
MIKVREDAARALIDHEQAPTGTSAAQFVIKAEGGSSDLQYQPNGLKSPPVYAFRDDGKSTFTGSDAFTAS